MDELNSYLATMLTLLRARTLLYAGCAYGDRIAGMPYLGVEAVGIDIAKKYIEKAKGKYPHIKFMVKDIRTYKSKKKYDVVFTHGCLIHITHKDIKKTIKNLMNLGKEGIFVESEGEEQKFKLKYDNEIYWNHRARFPEKKNELPMQYYYCHDYEELFKKLGYQYQMIKEFNKDNKTRMWRVYE